jgi:spore maturation protein A
LSKLSSDFSQNNSILYTKGGLFMVMSWFWMLTLTVSILCATLMGRGAMLASSIVQGAQAGVSLAISLAGSLCLWSGVGRLLEAVGITEGLSHLLRPVLFRLFPSARDDPELSRALSGNICANFLGLGNAATPMGIRAAKALHIHNVPHQLTRLVVLNTASIQLIPATVAALRGTLGCDTPFDILLPVWITSFCSAGLGVTAARLLERTEP